MARITHLITRIALAWLLASQGCIQKNAESPPNSGSSEPNVTRHLGLWVQDAPMLRNSVAMREAFKIVAPKDHPKFLAGTPVAGFLFSASHVHIRKAGEKPELHSAVASIVDKDGDIELELFQEGAEDPRTGESGKISTVVLKIDGEMLTLRPVDPKGPAVMYRRCDSACEARMDAGDRILFASN